MLFPNITGIAIGSHRGLTNQPNNLGHPPNTIASFTTTNQHHANYIECDCIMTLDNKIVLFHDKTINTQPISKQTLASLQNNYPNIETLDILLKHLTPHNTSSLTNKYLCLEIKYYETTKKRKTILAQTILTMLANYNLNKKTRIVSFDPEILQIIYDTDPTYILGLNIIFNKKYHKKHPNPKNTLTHPIITKIQFCCPHINEYDHPKLPPNLPKLIWESNNEDLIYKTLTKIQQTNCIHTWFSKQNIIGITTNTVEKVFLLLTKNQPHHPP
tara:strand:+ start:2823 stop:3638 length:816 start_codon:yes stop_codon:yes gene_type:complete